MGDTSDFPAIGSRMKDMQSSNILPYRAPSGYGQVIKPPDTPQEFQIDHEDFPALPGTSNAKLSEPGDQGPEKRLPLSSIILPEVKSGTAYDLAPGGSKERPSATPIGPPKGTLKKAPQQNSITVPPGMVQDQFGMMGLLTFIRAAETDPNLVALALGSDLTTLGLNLNSPESLCNIFASPWADSPCRAQDIDCNVPQEYLIHTAIKDKLASIQLKRYGEDLLFYLYYNNGGDLLQLLASIELYNRDWRYHKEDKVWITRAPGVEPGLKTPNYEKGSYYFFDPNQWRKTLKEFLIEYDKLEEKPQLPSTLGAHHTNTVPQSQ
jgi:CCR4-NOT transcription complex subunit 2